MSAKLFDKPGNLLDDEADMSDRAQVAVASRSLPDCAESLD